MRRLFSFCASLSVALLACAALVSFDIRASEREPIKALILTSPGVYHNYQQQTRDLAYGIAAHANVRFDVSLAELERWKSTDFAEGYDVLIYNICMADNQDAALIANLRRQTEELAVPAVVIHCSMHSFRDTDRWWPMLGLQTRAHEPLRPLPQVRQATHPILSGLPEEWTVKNDELYINVQFEGEPLLATEGEDGVNHVTTWLAQGVTPVFGTTLGHSEDTMKDGAFHRLIANGVLFVTGNLMLDGKPKPGLEAKGDGMDIFDTFSAPEGVRFLGQDGMDCAMRRLAMAVGPCYVGCTLNPIKWGDAARACKRECEAELPPSDELIAACKPEA
jgi:uncharacterized protein